MITTEKCWNQHHLLITYSGSEQMWLGHLMGTEPAKPPLCAYHCNRTGHSAFGSYPNVLAIVDKRVSVFEEASPMHRATVAERVTAPESLPLCACHCSRTGNSTQGSLPSCACHCRQTGISARGSYSYVHATRQKSISIRGDYPYVLEEDKIR